ncbi:MAG: hypothetical protein MZV63_55435 [Marinilabiliales bacterium]|nr:hypothetical protein [Marinilabiliales bacterium]
MFRETEGVSIHPAAAVAVGSLIHAAREKSIPPDACIMLNITGEVKKNSGMAGPCIP